MKKLILLAGLCVPIAIGIAFTATTAVASVKTSASVVGTADWAKSKDGTWEGMKDGKKIWYKLNTKDVTIWWSTDAGKTWTASKDGMWQDKDGKWLKIDNKMLKWSADGGKTWADVPEWKWEGNNGTWYKFDKDWSLWWMGGKM